MRPIVRASSMSSVPAQLLLAGIFALSGMLAGAPARAVTESYIFDKGHTEIIFKYNHVGNSTAYGRFDDYDGTITMDLDEPRNTHIDVTIKTDSIDTGVPALDAVLRGADFFDTQKYPAMRFVSRSVKQLGKGQWEVSGDLTVKTTTKPVVLRANLNFKGLHPLSPYIAYYKGKHVAGFSARAQILRSDFDMGLYVPLTSDLVDIVIETELFRQE